MTRLSCRTSVSFDVLRGTVSKSSKSILSASLEAWSYSTDLLSARTTGDALFVGNSMPIRDMDAFGGAAANAGPEAMGAVDQGLGVPLAANRGASGIDGVLSTAAGYAFGLNKAVTLVIGDVSFLHDINGLNLLRGGTAPSFPHPFPFSWQY